MSNFGVDNVKDLTLSFIAILNDVLTEDSIFRKLFCKLCCCACCPIYFMDLKKYFVYQTIFSIRIFIGILLHLVEVFIVLVYNETKRDEGLYIAAITVCVCLFLLLIGLIVYVVFMILHIKKGSYRQNIDWFAASVRSDARIKHETNPHPTEKYLAWEDTFQAKIEKKFFKGSVIIFFLFKILSVFVSLGVWVSMKPSNGFEQFFYVYGVCDFSLTLAGCFTDVFRTAVEYFIYLFEYGQFHGDLSFDFRNRNKIKQMPDVTTIEMQEIEENVEEIKDYLAWSIYNFLFNFYNCVACFCVIPAICYSVKARKAIKQNNMPMAKRFARRAKQLNYLAELCYMFTILSICIVICIMYTIN